MHDDDGDSTTTLNNDKHVVDPDAKHEKGDDGVHYDVDDNDNLDDDEHVVDPNAKHEEGDDGVHRAEDKAKAGAKSWERIQGSIVEMLKS